ncbi:MAG: hypothetical protein R6X32_20060 [Chloroflexota bacterium]
MAKQRRSQANPLVRRLRQHANMAAIFRTTADFSSPTAVSSDPNPVKAFVWSTGNVPQAIEAPPGGPPSGATPRPTPAAQPPSQQVTGGQTAVTNPAVPPTSETIGPTASPIQRQPDKPASPGDKPHLLTRLWQRLGTMVQPRSVSAPDSPSVAAGPSPVAGPPSDKPARLASSEKVGEPASLTTRNKDASKPTPPPIIQRQPETAVTPAPVSPPAEQEPAATPPKEDRNWQRLETIMQRHKERLVAEETAPAAAPDTLPTSAAESPTMPKQPAPETELPPEPDKQAAPGRSERGPGRAQTPTTAADHRPPAKSVTAPAAAGIEEVGAAGLETAVDDTPLPTNSALPLQEAWPVQRLASVPTPASAAVGKPTAPIPAPGTVATDSSVQERLAQVPPGRPTDSSVPLLRPRRPRPERPSVLSPLPPAPTLPDDLPLPGDPRLPAATSESQTPPPPVIQRQKEAAQLVPTEIGDLPADLWQLIGQQPPDSAAAPPAPAANSSNYIQRQPETMGAAVEQREESAESDTNAEDEAKETVDVDELARQVYAQLKQQLAADKERERGRFVSDW